MKRVLPPLSVSQALVFGTLTVGALDILDAFFFFGLRGVAPLVILQSIASGLLGSAAYDGGASTAILGGLLHFFIASVVVATYLGLSKRFTTLIEHPLFFGVLYGIIVYGVMNLVVVPLSAASVGSKDLPVIVNGLLIHVVGVGIPSALFSRAAHRAPRVKE